ncbi:MAG: hypothetical protein RIQ93_2459, partial [Verrucomicrobiota bacterium]
QQRRDFHQWNGHARRLEELLQRENYADVAKSLGIAKRLSLAKKAATAARQPDYVKTLMGTLGLDPALVKELSAR